mgnify:FL=1
MRCWFLLYLDQPNLAKGGPMNSIQETRKVFVACALGAGIGSLIALEMSAGLWWVGLLVGGLTGYLAYDFKVVARAIPMAARVATHKTAVEWKKWNEEVNSFFSNIPCWVYLYGIGIVTTTTVMWWYAALQTDVGGIILLNVFLWIMPGNLMQWIFLTSLEDDYALERKWRERIHMIDFCGDFWPEFTPQLGHSLLN